MILSTSSGSYSSNFEFTLVVTLKGEDQNLYPGSCLVTLSELNGSTLSGTNSGYVNAGTGYFNLWFVDSGNKRVQASCSSTGTSIPVTSSIQLSILQNILKVVAISPIVNFM
jgi:hypothetical protein